MVKKILITLTALIMFSMFFTTSCIIMDPYRHTKRTRNSDYHQCKKECKSYKGHRQRDCKRECREKYR